MWELYDALIAGLPDGEFVMRSVAGACWTLAENTSGGSGLSMTTEGETVAPMYPGGIDGLSLGEAALAAKSWNLAEAGLGVAAINSHYNTQENARALSCLEAYKTPCTRGLALTGRTVGLVGHLRLPEEALEGAGRVYILERSPKPGDYPDSACEFLLPECDIVLITGSSLVNKTLPRLLELCREAFVILVGPTVPLCPDLLDLGIDRLAGMCVTDREAAYIHAASAPAGSPYHCGRSFLFGR